MTASITRCCGSWPSLAGRLFAVACAVLLLAGADPAHAGSIEPVQAELKVGEDGTTLAAEFTVDLGLRLEDAVSRGVPLYFNLEFTLERNRWYWLSEQVVSINIHYRLAYNALTRQYRLSFGGLHQSFFSLDDALRVISRVAALPVAERGVLKAGETYAAALRLSLDRNQLPKPLQVDAIANSDWQVSARILRWQFSPKPEIATK